MGNVSGAKLLERVTVKLKYLVVCVTDTKWWKAESSRTKRGTERHARGHRHMILVCVCVLTLQLQKRMKSARTLELIFTLKTLAI